MMKASSNPGDGSDPRGRELDIRITIAADGIVYLHDITADLLPVLRALCPRDESLRSRAQAAARLAGDEGP